MHWFWLVLLCAFSAAAADAATKRLLPGYSAREIVVVRFAVTGALLSPLLVQHWTSVPAPFWGWVGALVPLELSAMWLYAEALRRAPLSQTQPYLAFTPVFTILTGYLLLGEQVSPRGATGIGLVAAGAYLLNIRHANSGSRYALLQPLKAMLPKGTARRQSNYSRRHSIYLRSRELVRSEPIRWSLWPPADWGRRGEDWPTCSGPRIFINRWEFLSNMKRPRI